MKKLFLVLLAVGAGLGIQACSGRDVATGAAVVGGALVAGAAADYYYGSDYRWGRGYYDGNYYWDRYDGRWYRNGSGRWYRDRNCRRYDRFGNCKRWYGTMAVAQANVNPDKAVAKRYLMSSDSAQTVLATLESLKQTGDLQVLKAIGLDDRDLRFLASGQTPESESVARVSSRLGADKEAVKALFQDVRDEYSLQKQYNWRVPSEDTIVE